MRCIIIIKKDVQFEKLKDVNLKILNSPHTYEVELGVSSEEWAIKPKKK